jgi:hypothetical protein
MSSEDLVGAAQNKPESRALEKGDGANLEEDQDCEMFKRGWMQPPSDYVLLAAAKGVQVRTKVLAARRGSRDTVMGHMDSSGAGHPINRVSPNIQMKVQDNIYQQEYRKRMGR